MSIISYAQNFEDVMLHRALKNIEQGFYIDVGANDPEVDSVTKAFYDMGWKGINIEPVSEWHEKLQQHRPRDINLQVAAGAGEGEITLFEIPQTGLSTTDEKIANRHQKERGYETISKHVPVKTLREICSHYDVAQIHFLKIDVEGGEKSVLEGIDFKIIRPWIILIESTLPNTQIEDYQDWEPLILESGYQFAYFDGLNRFYVSLEHADLLTYFETPPNFFDGFSLSSTCSFSSHVTAELQLIEDNLLQANERAEQAEANAQQANERAEQAEANAQQATGTLQAVLNSCSWRITAPLRFTSQTVKSSNQKIRSHARLALQHAFLYINRRAKLKKCCLLVLNRLPNLKSRLMSITNTTTDTACPSLQIESSEMLDSLSPRAYEIYHQLKTEIDKKQKGKI